MKVQLKWTDLSFLSIFSTEKAENVCNIFCLRHTDLKDVFLIYSCFPKDV